ncbi:hypothetical protein A9Q86_07340 [Flavobacteriales bacterium 33_180_T64]|nr:hypothetical protein A9Q86_07340 [Flavobacteriales bacterium 33_180_T64]
MKTKQLLSTLLIVFFVSIFSQSFSQNIDEPVLTDFNFTIPSEQIDIRTYEINLTDDIQYDFSNAPKSVTQYDAQKNKVAFAISMLAMGVGFGFTDVETLWCLHAEYYLRLALLKNAALYGAFGLAYNGISADNFTNSVTDVFLKILMVSILAKQFQQVFLQYGLITKYGFGNNKFDDGYKTDITTLSAGLILGLHILLTAQWSLMVQTNLLTYQEQTNTFEGNETKSDSTFGLINKNNLLALSLVYTFGNRNR